MRVHACRMSIVRLMVQMPVHSVQTRLYMCVSDALLPYHLFNSLKLRPTNVSVTGSRLLVVLHGVSIGLQGAEGIQFGGPNVSVD